MQNNLDAHTVFESGHEYVCKDTRIDVGNEDAVRIDTGEFPAVKTAFLLRGLSDVTLDFNGATFCMHGDIQPFTLIDCKNVTIKNVVVENQRSHYTEGEVVSSFLGKYRIRIGKKFPFAVKDKNLIVYGDGWRNDDIERHPLMFMQFYDKKTRKGAGLTLVNIGKTVPAYDKEHFFVHHMTAGEKNGDLILRSKSYFKHVKKGTHVVFEHESRRTGTMVACRCDDLVLDNFRVLNGSGMGITPICCNNVTLRKLIYTYDERSHGFVTNAADALHTFACSGKLVMDGCVLEGMIDDALNVHGNYFIVRSVKENSLFVRCGSLAFCDNDGPISHTYYFPLREGDVISVNRGASMNKRDEYTIKKIVHHAVNDDELVLDRTPVAEEGDMIEDLSAQVDLTIKNCTFGKANTHLRFQTRGKVLIENCTSELPFWLTGDTTYWFEGSPCKDFTVRNCRFVGKQANLNICPEITPTKNNPYYHENVTIENCSFDAPVVVNARLADNIVFKNNVCKNGKARIVAKRCGKIDAPDAVVIRTKI